MPEILNIAKARGIAGQVSYTATVKYEGEPASSVTFVGQDNDRGPVVMCTPANLRGVFVSDPGRFGVFGREWVRRFFE